MPVRFVSVTLPPTADEPAISERLASVGCALMPRMSKELCTVAWLTPGFTAPME